MKRILCCAFVLMLCPATSALAAPARGDIDGRATNVTEMMQGDDMFSCSAGGPGTLLVGAALLGLLARRPRRP